MTYHMESVSLKKSIDPELISTTPKAMERRVTFPERLWECVNDEKDLIKWSPKGDAVLVDEERFETEIMTIYPGLVAIKSYSNFRRQLRAYNFEWYVNADGYIEFLHPYFIRGHPELVSQIQTKRKSSGIPSDETAQIGSGDKMESVGRRPKQKRRDPDDQEDESNLEQGEIKVQEQPKPKRKYTRRKRKGSTFTNTQQSPRMSASPRTSEGFHDFNDRPPAPPFCSCPWHCPVSWDSYEGMMQNWTKGAPHPGYWYPPPYPPHPQYMTPVNNQDSKTDTGASDNIQGAEVNEDRTLSEPSTQSMEQLDDADNDQESDQIGETTSNCGQTVTTQTEQPFHGPAHPPMPYPMAPDPWRLQHMGGMPFYQGMPYGMPMIGPQRPQPCPPYPPHMPYPYMMEGMSQDEHQQQYNQSALNEATQQINAASKHIQVDKATNDDYTQTNSDPSMQQMISDQNESIETNETTLSEESHKTPVKIQRQHSLQTVTPSRSTIPQYLKRRQEANSSPGHNEQPLPVNKPPDEVSTEQLITNVGIQQHNMMVLMGQQQQEQHTYQQAQEVQSWQQNQFYPSADQMQHLPEGQAWAHQSTDMQAWQQHSDQVHVRETMQQDIQNWMEASQGGSSTVNGEDVMLEVEVASQGSQCSGPLDLSSTEVTIVTMDKNIPVRLAAVVQDDDAD